jgi:hypothetical protein
LSEEALEKVTIRPWIQALIASTTPSPMEEFKSTLALSTA